jgi:hypothetical protein
MVRLRNAAPPHPTDTCFRASAFSLVALCGAVLQPVIAASQYVIHALEYPHSLQKDSLLLHQKK